MKKMLAKLYGAVSRKPMAISDALVYELSGLNEDETATVERGDLGREVIT